jgi:hypothetical protein
MRKRGPSVSTNIADIVLRPGRSDWEICLGDTDGPPVAILVHGPRSADAVGPVHDLLRDRHQSVRDLVVVHVVDLRGVARPFRKIAESELKKAHKKAVDALPEGREPKQYVLIVPDWRGTITASLGAADVDKHPVGVVVAGAQAELFDLGDAERFAAAVDTAVAGAKAGNG